MVKRVSSREARTHFAELTDRVKYTGEPVIVEKQGQPFVAVVSLDDLKELEELQRERARSRFEKLAAKAHASTPDDAPTEDEVVAAVKRTREEIYRERYGAA